jgi:RimJ/RimL family protein N-acetyltransferase
MSNPNGDQPGDTLEIPVQIPGSRNELIQHLKEVPYDRRVLDQSWLWMQDEEFRYLNHMTMISREEQLKWFEGLRNRDNYYIWGIELDTNPVGVYGIKNVAEKRGEYWGFIGVKEYWGKGIGSWIMSRAILHARDLGLEELVLNVLKDNHRAINLYKKFSFRTTFQDYASNLLWMSRKIDVFSNEARE